MKIAFLVDEFPRAHSPFITNQIAGLIGRGYDVDIYSTGRPEENDIANVDESVRKSATYTNIPEGKPRRVVRSLPHLSRISLQEPSALSVVTNPFKFGKDALGLKPVYRLSSMLGESYDVLHAHFGPKARVAAILKEVGICERLFATFQGYGIREARNEPERYQHLFDTGDYFMGSSKFLCEELRSHGLDEEKISLHHNGLHLDRFPFRWSRTLNTPPDPIKIITVARLEEIKGIRYGIKAIANLVDSIDRDVEYHLIGGGSLHNELSNLTHALDIQDIITFHGHQHRDVVIDRLQQAHLFMLPSLEEGLGTVLLEAQATGLPIVASDVGGIPEGVAESAAILVPPAAPEAITEALKELIESPERWVEMGNAGRQHVEKDFNIEKLNNKLIQKYEQFE